MSEQKPSERMRAYLDAVECQLGPNSAWRAVVEENDKILDEHHARLSALESANADLRAVVADLIDHLFVMDKGCKDELEQRLSRALNKLSHPAEPEHPKQNKRVKCVTCGDTGAIEVDGSDRMCPVCKREQPKPDEAKGGECEKPTNRPADSVDCGYCGTVVQRGGSWEELDAAGRAHAAVCSKHPLRTAEAETANLRAIIVTLKDRIMELEALQPKAGELAKLREELRWHHDEENRMCDEMNAVIDANGGWREEGSDTYAENFARIINTERTRAEKAEAENAKLEGYLRLASNLTHEGKYLESRRVMMDVLRFK